MDTSITQEELKSILDYNSKTGTFTWKVSKARRIKIGSVAGTLHKSGYRYILIGRKSYAAHRLAFLFMTGNIPKYVDHIDTNRDNNSWENLREATKSQNGYNRCVDSRNTSGIKGVFWHKLTNKWSAAIRVERKLIHIGLFKEKEDAEKAVILAREEYHKEFSRHG